MLPAMDICKYILGPDFLTWFHEDNTALIRVIRTGHNPTLRHLGRTHGVDIASMREKFYKLDKLDILYEKSSLMAADIFTKAYTSAQKWHEVAALINVYGAEFRKTIGVEYIVPKPK